MKIKLFTISTILIFSAFLVQAQESDERRHEATLLIKSYDDIGIGYRFGTSSALWRISLSGGVNDGERIVNDTTIQYFNNESFIGIDLGREYRFSVANNLFLRIGGDIFYNYSLYKIDNGPDARFRVINENVNNEFGFKMVSGLIFQPMENIHLGFEFLPSFSWIKSERSAITGWNDGPLTEDSSSSIETFNFNLSNSSLRFNIGFNF